MALANDGTSEVYTINITPVWRTVTLLDDKLFVMPFGLNSGGTGLFACVDLVVSDSNKNIKHLALYELDDRIVDLSISKSSNLSLAKTWK